MLDYSKLKKFDPQGTYEIYDKWPRMAEASYHSEQESVDFKDIDHLVFAGMGGSGTIGDVFSSILSKTAVHVYVVKGYHLPTTVNRNTLVITSSISGNTAETLSILKSAKKKGSKIVSFSSGGKMKEYCEKNRIRHVTIPMVHSPRVSFTTYLYSMLKILKPIIPVRTSDIDESIQHLYSMRKKISYTNMTESNPSLHLAKWMTGIPIIYYPHGLESAAMRFKNSIQENAKTHAMAEDIIEACHNGIVAWERPSNIQPILIQGRDDYIKTKEIWKIMKKYFDTNDIDYAEVHSIQGSIISKIINLIYLLDYSTIYRAVMSKVDPSPTKSIQYIKRRLH